MKRFLKRGGSIAVAVLAATLLLGAQAQSNFANAQQSNSTASDSNSSGQRTTDVQGTPSTAGQFQDNRGISTNGNNNGVVAPGFGAPTYGGPALSTPGNGSVATSK
jgi:hypothetical protein